VCTSRVGPRSYEVKIGDNVYRRNRRQLIHANEPPQPLQELQPAQLAMDTDNLEDNLTPDTETTTPPTAEPINNNSPRRSGRVTKKPKWMEDYVPS